MRKEKEIRGNWVTMERQELSGMYAVRLEIGGELHDKVRCDTYRGAMDYWHSFCKIARNY